VNIQCPVTRSQAVSVDRNADFSRWLESRSFANIASPPRLSRGVPVSSPAVLPHSFDCLSAGDVTCPSIIIFSPSVSGSTEGCEDDSVLDYSKLLPCVDAHTPTENGNNSSEYPHVCLAHVCEYESSITLCIGRWYTAAER
jgi:hypothetical protein